MKAVFHLNTGEVSKQSELLGNIQNLMDDGTVEVDQIAVLLNADGVDMLERGSQAEEFLEEFIDEGVEVKACSNSLENREIDEEELIDGVDTVPSGVGELTRLQEEGFHYIKP